MCTFPYNSDFKGRSAVVITSNAALATFLSCTGTFSFHLFQASIFPATPNTGVIWRPFCNHWRDCRSCTSSSSSCSNWCGRLFRTRLGILCTDRWVDFVSQKKRITQAVEVFITRSSFLIKVCIQSFESATSCLTSRTKPRSSPLLRNLSSTTLIFVAQIEHSY